MRIIWVSHRNTRNLQKQVPFCVFCGVCVRKNAGTQSVSLVQRPTEKTYTITLKNEKKQTEKNKRRERLNILFLIH